MYGSYPFYMGVFDANVNGEKITKTYGIFFDNTYKSTFNFGSMSHPFSYFRAEGGEMKYFVIGGNTPKKVLQNYTQLTGRINLPPLWSLGFQQCRYSYYPDTEIYNLAKTFREKKIPCDVLYLDIHYMDKYKVFTWDKKNFPNPQKLIKDLEELGFHVVLIFDPGIKVENGYKPYEEGLKKEVFVNYPKTKRDFTFPYTGNVWPGACHFPDFTNEKVREWWGENMKDLTEMNILGFWNDMNEPAVWGKDFPDMTEFYYEGQTASHRKAHNIYGMQMARATAENAKKQAKGKRPFILTRAGYAGVQRYGAVWTGDNVSEDNNMLGDIRLVNNMGLAGLSFAGYDIGGFVGEVQTKVFNKWIGYGAFSPFARCHTMINSKDAEPWAFGEETEEIARNYINLRYRLLPYLYSAFYEATQNGMPIQRSLLFEYANDQKIYEGNYQNQYFFGQSILVCAITANQPIHKIYLPKGTWYNMWNDEKNAGNQEIFVEIPQNKIPVYVRAGEMLLLQSLTQHTQEKPSDTLEWHIYYANEGEYRLQYYEDDGVSYEYENGNERFIKKTFVYDANQQIFYIENESQKFDRKKSKKKKNEDDLPPYKSKFPKLKIYFHQFPADLIKDYYQKENYRFIDPISNFDPWEHAEDMSTTIVDLAYLEVVF
jgi:alpha-glucosidase